MTDEQAQRRAWVQVITPIKAAYEQAREQCERDRAEIDPVYRDLGFTLSELRRLGLL